jgi:hypothetical protein
VARRTLPAVLAFGAVIADLAGSHGVALALTLGAVPAAFALALECYGDALEARCGLVRPLTAAAALVLLVFSAALRSPAVVGGVPQLAVSTLVLTVLLYVAVAVEAVLQGGRTVPESA